MQNVSIAQLCKKLVELIATNKYVFCAVNYSASKPQIQQICDSNPENAIQCTINSYNMSVAIIKCDIANYQQIQQQLNKVKQIQNQFTFSNK
jgi:hypothetical protein